MDTDVTHSFIVFPMWKAHGYIVLGDFCCIISVPLFYSSLGKHNGISGILEGFDQTDTVAAQWKSRGTLLCDNHVLLAVGDHEWCMKPSLVVPHSKGTDSVCSNRWHHLSTSHLSWIHLTFSWCVRECFHVWSQFLLSILSIPLLCQREHRSIHPDLCRRDKSVNVWSQILNFFSLLSSILKCSISPSQDSETVLVFNLFISIFSPLSFRENFIHPSARLSWSTRTGHNFIFWVGLIYYLRRAILT